MTKAEESKCAEMMADEVIRIINLFGTVLHIAKMKGEEDEQKHHAEG